jgi:deoxyribodipyrimidine photo-lyase
VDAVLRREGWSLDDLSPKADGGRAGWWGVSASAEAFLDQVVTWRELGHQACAHRDDVQEFDGLPAWAQRTLREHAKDPRPHRYDRGGLDRSATHDPIWNAAQRELRHTGRLQNYLRMLWGKKVLEWSRSPEEALATLIHLNDRYAVDGRDPNSYAGITWCFGQYDRPWAPERPIFGVVRYMSSDNTVRKLRLKEYLRRFADPGVLFPDQGRGDSVTPA